MLGHLSCEQRVQQTHEGTYEVGYKMGSSLAKSVTVKSACHILKWQLLSKRHIHKARHIVTQ